MTEKSSDIKKINDRIEKIQNAINKQGSYSYYLIDDDTVKLVSKDHEKNDAENDFLSKINKKKKYINNVVYTVDIVIDKKYITHEHKLVGGPVSLKIEQYYIDKKYQLNYKADYKSGAVWYTNEDIKNNMFHLSDIKQIIKIIHDNNVNILSIGRVRAVKILNEDFT